MKHVETMKVHCTSCTDIVAADDTTSRNETTLVLQATEIC